jgi:hypothetical protein
VIIKVVVVMIGISAVVLGRGLFYYDGFYQAPLIEIPNYTQVIIPSAPSTEYSDSYVMAEGTILFDIAHENAFSTDELNVLILRLISRGLAVDFFGVDDSLAERLLGEQKDSELEYINEVDQEETVEEVSEVIEQEESPPNALVVICPQEEFARDEIKDISKFVENGGKLLLIDDPTRRGQTNSLAYNFGLIFEADYLYNMKENDANYRNIFINNFKENSITDMVQSIVLYTTGSISSDNYGIAFGDENTFSSQIETRKELSPMALAEESKVLAVHDLTFISEPYNGILDNNKLISNIANWLASNTHD